jgi:hypothetical protein
MEEDGIDGILFVGEVGIEAYISKWDVGGEDI